MATSTIDGTVEEAVLRRRRNQLSVYESIKFRLDDGSTKTWTKAQVMNNVVPLLAPGTRGRFYLFTGVDNRGVSGVRTDDGREAFGAVKLLEQAWIWALVIAIVLLVLNLALSKISFLAVILIVLSGPMYLVTRQNRLDSEKAFAADAGYRPPARAA
jgi:hypothetical protein